jgi:hypothetical protein
MRASERYLVEEEEAAIREQLMIGRWKALQSERLEYEHHRLNHHTIARITNSLFEITHNRHHMKNELPVVRGERRVTQNAHQGRNGNDRIVLLGRRRETRRDVVDRRSGHRRRRAHRRRRCCRRRSICVAICRRCRRRYRDIVKIYYFKKQKKKKLNQQQVQQQQQRRRRRRWSAAHLRHYPPPPTSSHSLVRRQRHRSLSIPYVVVVVVVVVKRTVNAQSHKLPSSRSLCRQRHQRDRFAVDDTTQENETTAIATLPCASHCRRRMQSSRHYQCPTTNTSKA